MHPSQGFYPLYMLVPHQRCVKIRSLINNVKYTTARGHEGEVALDAGKERAPERLRCRCPADELYFVAVGVVDIHRAAG